MEIKRESKKQSPAKESVPYGKKMKKVFFSNLSVSNIIRGRFSPQNAFGNSATENSEKKLVN